MIAACGGGVHQGDPAARIGSEDRIGQSVHQRVQSAALLLQVRKLFVGLCGKLIEIGGHALDAGRCRGVGRGTSHSPRAMRAAARSIWLTGTSQLRRRITSPARARISAAANA